MAMELLIPVHCANLTSLIRLSANGNRIVEVTPLANLENLNYLELQDNLITDITPLVQSHKFRIP